MRFNQIQSTLKTAVSSATFLLLGAGIALAQQQVNLTAGPTSITLPDGSNVPMWGYSCGAPVGGSTATCVASNPAATGWSPVVITVPTGQSLTINLTNNLSFTPAGSTSPNTIPTSLTIVGQVGGGLGSGGTSTPSPEHPQQVTTWSTVAAASAVWTPPAQGPRVQSFGTEVAFGATTALTWTTPRAGTYLLESGTHPSIQGPMGLIGALVVTSAPASSGGTETVAGTAYPNVSYDAEVPLIFSEIDPAQNNAVNAAVNTAGFSETASRGPTVGGAVAEVNITNPGSGFMTTPPSVSFTGGGGSGATATAYINTPCTSAGVPAGCGAISIVVTSGGTNYTSAPTVILTGGDGTGAAAQAYLARGTNSIATCSTPGGTVPACYPPVVNYTPLYYTINGVAFNRASASASLFPVTPATLAPASGTGSVLVRFVNAGLHMHVPTIVGSLTQQLATGTAATVGGFELIAEDGNPLPGIPRVQSEVFMSAGKTYDVLINAPAAGGTALPVYDRELSLSGNAVNRDAGMLAYLSINGSGLPSAGSLAAATANPDTYNSVVAGFPLTVSDPAKGVIANDVNVLGVQVSAAPTQGTLSLNTNGTFTYVPNAGWSTSDSFGYCANGATLASANAATLCTTVTLGPAPVEAATGITLTCPAPSYTSKEATYIKVPPPGVLSCIKDALGYPVTVDLSTVTPTSGLSINMDANGGFSASVSGPTISTFTFQVKNSQGTEASNPTGSTPATPLVTATLTFPAGSGLNVSVVDGKTKSPVTDYRWIIEEDKSFYISPNCTSNPPPAGCIQTASGTVPLLGTNFHTSDMTYVAQGCTGQLSCESGQMVVDPSTGSHVPAVCDLGNGACRPDTTGNGKTPVNPSQVALDPSKRYYISVLPGDASDPFQTGNSGTSCAPINGGQSCGHSMGGAPVPVACTPAPGQTTCIGSFPPVTVFVEQDPFPPAKLSVNVFEDDFPLNGEQDSGGGVDVLSPNEPGLGGFNIILWDDMGGSGDVTGQMTYDMFNQPLSNSLDGTIDPVTGQNACPISNQGQGITGMIVTCPKYEQDGVTLSPLAGQAVVANLMPGRFSVQAIAGADRIAKGEEWLQTNTLDGQHAHDSFLRIGEPAYFQEFGPAGYHVSIGFANPKIISSRLAGVCAGTDSNITGINCNNTLTGKVTTERMSRTPDERLYSSGSRDSFYFTQCYVSVGDPDGEDFAFTKCNADGTFTLSGLPDGNWRVTTFDQWNDQIVDGLSFPVGLALGADNTSSTCTGPKSTATTCDMGDVAANQWQANVYTRTFIDDNKDGVSQPSEGGIPFINTTVRYRDGSLSNNLVTDLTGTANFNEEFPLFNWYVVETDTTRYKTTGIHTVYDAGGPADGTTSCGQISSGYPNCGSADPKSSYAFLANTAEKTPLPSDLSVPGSVYCPTADCANETIQGGSVPSGPGVSTGRIDPPWLGGTEGWQGYSGQNNFIEFGKAPYTPGENGGIKGHVIYASTRPFDDPQMLVQTQWEPLVPHVKINLYQEGTAADGITPTLTLVDTTQTSSFDDFAQGFQLDPKTGNPIVVNGHYVPNMNCPGQTTSDLFFFSLENQPNYLDYYNNVEHAGGTGSATPLPYNSQYKCYDGMHNWNQLQPVPYDGMYSFPSVTARDANGKPTGTNCTACTIDPASDEYGGIPMLKPGKYVVEVVPPQGYEIVKEEDKNILIGDNFIAPVTQEFGGLSDIFIIPDQAQVGSAYNPYNAQNSTQSLGAQPNNGIVPGFTPEPTWPCVGQTRVVPDYISLFPESKQMAPFAGATRNLCDRKEVTLNDQAGAIAKFYVYTSTHKAAKFTGVITDDFTSEFDPFSPQFGEKFAPPNMPIAIKDWTGAEIGRVYSDWWGDYDGLTYSTWEVNPPNPTGYSPTMMIFCMNDRGTGTTPDPLFNPAYSQFCYELPYMPGQTAYLDTPVVPTSAFSAGYNHPDCAYPNATPAISEVDGDKTIGPWASAPGVTLTIHSLPDQPVPNYGFSGPQAHTAPYNQQTVTRHYGFGATAGTVTIGGVAAPIQSWSDTLITVTVPAGVPLCAVQQQAQFGGSTAYCGQLVITTATGQQSVDTVTVTIGGKMPTVLPASASQSPLTPSNTGAIQQAIDNAMPGDMIIVPPGDYQEMLIMWKPVRLQGVGAASSIIDANSQPGGKLDPWRRQIDCVFGIAINGTPISASNQYDPTSTFTCGPSMQFSVDRLPLEATVGWDATLNGNLAELLQEPTLMGAYEGAGITVLGKGVNFPAGSAPFGSDTFPTGTLLLTAADCATGPSGTNPNPSNFQCNPSSIDGMGITDSSQGGGGIFAHGWTHNLQVANNRIYSNIGTLTGGINIGQGEFSPGYFQGGTTNSAPGSCMSNAAGPGIGIVNSNLVANQELPYCFDLNVNVHNNYVTSNSSIGDELFSATPAGAGGVSFCTGADYYKFNYNWVCGNMSTGDGGGVAHLGLIWNGDIENNSILFNQSLNPTIPTHGGGIQIQGTPDVDPACGATTDADCAPPGMSDGTGPGLVINANLIQGNAAESGSGGGLRLQNVNGTDVTGFPNQPNEWYSVSVTNNIIVNNVAGWDGAGVSLQDALAANLVNNTIASNDSTASAGVLFNTLGAPMGGSPNATYQTTSSTTSAPQPAGLVSVGNSAPLLAAIATLPGGGGVTCPTNHSGCASYSNPYLANDLFWQNRTFFIGVGSLSPSYQQNVVTMYNSSFTSGVPSTSGTPLTGQTATGQCVNGSTYWDIGVRGDTGPGNHGSGFTLAPTYSLLTNSSEIPAGTVGNLNADPAIASQYCNGSRVPPELSIAQGGNGGLYNVPPGISDATVPNPIFNLTPAATVDEGNNWINLTWGPLSMVNPATGAVLGNYALNQGSSAIDYVPNTSPTFSIAPSTDFFGNPRPDPAVKNYFDIGAIEYQGANIPTLTSIVPNSGYLGDSYAVTLTGTNLINTSAVNVPAGVTVSNLTLVSSTTVTAILTVAPTAATGAASITITAAGGTSNAVTFTITPPPPPTLASITPASARRGTAASVTITGANFTTAGTTVAVSNPGITVSGVTVVNSTTITATFTSTLTAAPGASNVTVTTPGGTSNALTFMVVGPGITSIAPATGQRGNLVPVTLTGVGFTGATAINVSGTGVSVSGLSVVSDTQITATFTIAPNAGLGVDTVSVTAPGGTSNTVTFTVVNPPAPTLSSIAPNTGQRGDTVPVTLTGTNFTTNGITVTVPGGGVTVGAINVVNSTTLTTTFTIAANASATARNVSVSSPGGTSATQVFTVINPTPTLTAISPNSGLRGAAVPVTLTGTNFTTTGTSIALTGSGVTIGGTTVVNSTTITATFTINATTTLGARSVTVTTPAGVTAPVTFTVNGPALTSINPATGARGNIVPVTLSGSGLTGATAIGGLGGGVTASGLTVVNDSTVTANFAITAAANLTARNVTVTAPGGTSNAVTFTVVTPAPPTLTTLTPNSGFRGTTVPVTLTGTNFTTTGTTVAVSGGGVTVSGVTVVNSTTITANFAVSGSAALTARNVTVTTPGGTSGAQTFTVKGPVLSSIAPPKGARGSSVPIMLTGSGLTGTTAITVSGTGVTVGAITVGSDTSVTATFTIAPTASVTGRTVTVTAPGGTSNTVAFTVTGATVTFAESGFTTNPATAATKNGTVTVSNAAAATGPLALTAAPTIAKVSGAGTFTITGGTCTNGAVVNPGSSCTVLVQYVPSGTANSTANVTITGSGLATASLTSGNFTAN